MSGGHAKGNRVALAAVLGIMAVIVGTWLIATASSDTENNSKSGEGEHLPIAALRTEPEQLSPRLRQKALGTVRKEARRLKLRFDAVQRLRTAAGISEWVVPGRGVTCLFRQKMVAVACSRNALVRWKGMMLVVGEGRNPSDPGLPAHFLALGLVPDGTSAVRLHVIGGGSLVVNVANNTFTYKSKMPVELEELIH